MARMRTGFPPRPRTIGASPNASKSPTRVAPLSSGCLQIPTGFCLTAQRMQGTSYFGWRCDIPNISVTASLNPAPFGGTMNSSPKPPRNARPRRPVSGSASATRKPRLRKRRPAHLPEVSQIVGVKNACRVLKSLGATAHYHEYQGGHSMPCWRDELNHALTWLLADSNP
jgi:hypothetical protein